MGLWDDDEPTKRALGIRDKQILYDEIAKGEMSELWLRNQIFRDAGRAQDGFLQRRLYDAEKLCCAVLSLQQTTRHR